MSGLMAADFIRFRKRRAIQILVLAVPVLTAFLFLLGALSLGPEPAPFDPAAYRQQLIDQGAVTGMPDDQAGQILDSMVAGEADHQAFLHTVDTLRRSAFAFPQSVLTVLGNAYLVLFAMILLTATTLGDEFSWATIRISMLASSDRRRFLAVRLALIGAMAVIIVASVLALGVVLPSVASTLGAILPSVSSLDLGGLLVLIVGLFVTVTLVTAFAALATLLARSGGIAFVAVLVYVIVEAAILTALVQIPALREGGALDWIPNVVPVRGFVAFIGSAMGAAGQVPSYPDQVIDRTLAAAWVPLAALSTWALVSLVLAFRRFERMDIVE